MKKLLLLLLFTSASFSQQVYNVQEYCIDETPLNKGVCDIKGNEYSFVFVDSHGVTLFLADAKFKYQIISKSASGETAKYILKNEDGEASMTINRAATRIEFLQPARNISLIVGKSTKKQ